MTRIATLIALSLAMTACGGGSSPTTPSSVAPTAPAATATPAPAPAPAPSTLTGSWSQSGVSWMTLTQNGPAVTGSLVPTTVELGGLVSVFSGTVTGIVTGTTVNMTFQNMVTVRAGTDTLVCRGVDSWVGQISGNTLNGTFTPGTTPYICDGGIPLPFPQTGGTMIFTRQ